METRLETVVSDLSCCSLLKEKEEITLTTFRRSGFVEFILWLNNGWMHTIHPPLKYQYDPSGISLDLAIMAQIALSLEGGIPHSVFFFKVSSLII